MFFEKELTSAMDLEARTRLLAERGLGVPGRERRILGIFSEDGDLAATGSLVDGTIQGVAVADRFEGEGLMARIVSWLVEKAVLDGGRDGVRVFTKADAIPKFVDLGFRLVERTDRVGLLEWTPLFERHLRAWRSIGEGLSPARRIGAVVMNANPCTIGHEHLIRTAAADCDRLYVLVVEEDRSEFPFKDRITLVSASVDAMPPSLRSGIVVMPGGQYCISSATFPSYFTRDAERAAVHAELDLRLFVRQAETLGINRRYAGTEPFSPSTAAYNDAMARVLPPHGIEPIFVPRLEAGGRAVSASEVRRLLSEGRRKEAMALLPPPVAALFDTFNISMR